jgi:hypothetical protein
MILVQPLINSRLLEGGLNPTVCLLKVVGSVRVCSHAIHAITQLLVYSGACQIFACCWHYFTSAVLSFQLLLANVVKGNVTKADNVSFAVLVITHQILRIVLMVSAVILVTLVHTASLMLPAVLLANPELTRPRSLQTLARIAQLEATLNTSYPPSVLIVQLERPPLWWPLRTPAPALHVSLERHRHPGHRPVRFVVKALLAWKNPTHVTRVRSLLMAI